MKYDSYHPTQTKRAVVKSLTDRAKNLCSIEVVESEKSKVQAILKSNGYNQNFINRSSLNRPPSIENNEVRLRYVSVPYIKGTYERVQRVTMSYNETETHKKRRIAHPWVFRGTASAPFVPAQDLRAHGNSLSPHPRPLSTAVLARTIGKLPKHHASASAKSRDVNSTGDLAATLLESALASNPSLTGEVSATLAPCLSRHGQPAATLLKRKETVAWCAS